MGTGRFRLGRAHARVGHLRREELHKLTTRVAAEHGTIVVEDLNITGMLANRELARHIADAGFAEIRRQLAYKTGWNGGWLLVADRWYPSSKACSGCGTVRTELALHEREYECEACGLGIDRDRNAALNLAALAAEFDTAGSGPVTGRGADQKTRVRGQVAVKRQPGTTPVGQTGAVPPPGRTIDRALTQAG
ncbi:RNA-guided endonuclease TnpB family protein [Dactylosporangium sp. NPDC051541]|uniref:RNA-guided endonuclease TnpB family protein n=1 Tax=Dactylosporangium sp. NPDC051541 TaxID=3363977 RepID=UPI0037AD52EA